MASSNSHQAFFSTGTLIARRTDTANIAPSYFGVLQDVTLDFDRKMEDLIGQYQFPVAVAAGPFKIQGKAKAADLRMPAFNLLLPGTPATGMTELPGQTGETGTIPSSSAYTITVSNSATFLNDLGVFFQTGLGQLTPVASNPSAGQYSVSAGVYTFAAADAGKLVWIYYGYTIASQGYSLTVANQLMGSSIPTFEMYFRNSTGAFQGATNDLVFKLNNCYASKLAFGFKNTNWLVPEFDFEAIADSSLNVFTISSTN